MNRAKQVLGWTFLILFISFMVNKLIKDNTDVEGSGLIIFLIGIIVLIMILWIGKVLND